MRPRVLAHPHCRFVPVICLSSLPSSAANKQTAPLSPAFLPSLPLLPHSISEHSVYFFFFPYPPPPMPFPWQPGTDTPGGSITRGVSVPASQRRFALSTSLFPSREPAPLIRGLGSSYKLFSFSNSSCRRQFRTIYPPHIFCLKPLQGAQKRLVFCPTRENRLQPGPQLFLSNPSIYSPHRANISSSSINPLSLSFTLFLKYSTLLFIYPSLSLSVGSLYTTI